MGRQEPGHFVAVPEGFSREEIRQESLVTRDGVRLHCEVVGDGPETMVLANGLGGRLYAWAPLLRAFRGRFRMVTWDYRGLFESGAPEAIRRLSVFDHAEDLRELLDALDAPSAHLVGWSMGVQVSLEFATIYPERASSLVLLNGTYGQVFSSAFQPVLRLPWLQNRLHGVVEWLAGKERWLELLGGFVRRRSGTLFRLQRLAAPATRPDMEAAFRQYVEDVFATEMPNYLRLFQELDAHSVYHLLNHITQPALVMSGGLDVMTPPYQSRQMAARIPRARHRHFPLGSHYVLLEYPEETVTEIETFLSDVAAGRI